MGTSGEEGKTRALEPLSLWPILMDAPVPQGVGGRNSHIVTPEAGDPLSHFWMEIQAGEWESEIFSRSGQLSVPRYGGLPLQQAGERREAVLRDRDSWMPDPRMEDGQDCGRSMGVDGESTSFLRRNHGGTLTGGHWTEKPSKGQICPLQLDWAVCV